MKFLTTVFSFILLFVLSAEVSPAQDSAPPRETVVIKTDLESITGIGTRGAKLFISMRINRTTNTANVQIEEYNVMLQGRAFIEFDECEKIATTLEAAAKAIERGTSFEDRKIGGLSIGTDTAKVKNAADKVGETEQTVVRLSSTGSLSSLKLNVDNEGALKLAKAMREAPAIYARLNASIDADKIWKGK